MPKPVIDRLDPAKLHSLTKAAVEEFTAYSFEQASFNRIIKHSGLSKGSVYYYFTSKEDLFRTVVDQCVAALPEDLRQARLSPHPEQYWTEIKRIVSPLLAFFAEDPALASFLWRCFAERQVPDSHPAAGAIHQLEEWLADLLAIGQAKDAVRKDLPLNVLVDLTWNVFARAFDHLVVKREGQVSDEQAQRLITGFLARLLMPGT